MNAIFCLPDKYFSIFVQIKEYEVHVLSYISEDLKLF